MNYFYCNGALERKENKNTFWIIMYWTKLDVNTEIDSIEIKLILGSTKRMRKQQREKMRGGERGWGGGRSRERERARKIEEMNRCLWKKTITRREKKMFCSHSYNPNIELRSTDTDRHQCCIFTEFLFLNI